MIRKLLIANRGEIAMRIIRTCREMGIATVAVYSDADANALHVELADEAIHIGGNSPAQSYLKGDTIIEAAQRTQADAIHPGFGFLAENASFAQAVQDAGLIFVGPSPQSIEAMGDKRRAKLMLEDVPFVPGYMGEDQSEATLIQAATEIGYPIMIKATAGGGGKGMRLVPDSASLPDALAAAKREAQQSFGDDMVMLEKAILTPRHIEVQIIGDHHGQVIALGERECTIQRRHQKIVEESPSTALSDDLREAICKTAVNIGRQLQYVNAGTVEFLLDGDAYYFMEMNTRLQVEHPVTEEVFGVDLVQWQLEIAQGTPLTQLLPPFTDPELFTFEAYGHAIEVRVYAEDPANSFLPVIGTVLHWSAPAGVRVESGIRSGDEITHHYDPMIAKIIAHGETRAEALRKLDYALAQTALLGIRHNISYLRRVIMHPEHVAGNISTQFVEQHPDLLADDLQPDEKAIIAGTLLRIHGQASWRNNNNRPIRQRFKHQGEIITVDVVQTGQADYNITLESRISTVHLVGINGEQITLVIDGHRQSWRFALHLDDIWLQSNTRLSQLTWVNPLPLPERQEQAEGSLRAPMPGQITRILVETGQTVARGELLMIMEAMKMEHRIEAPYAGLVEMIRYQVGDNVQQDEILLALKADEGLA